MHHLPLLVEITVALVAAFLGGMLARRLKLPTLVGYLLAGIAIGPFTPGYVGDTATIGQLAELGVIFLMFGVGLHFSFADLWRVRDVAIPGALVQTALATLVAMLLTRSWGWSWTAGLVLGLSISVASTVVLLRGLTDHSLLNTAHGQAAVGWLVMEDIFSVLILVLMPVLAPGAGGFDWGGIGLTLAKAAAFLALTLVGGARVLPWLLERVAHMRSRELFLLAVLAMTLGTAMAAAKLFGVSLALGAFAAGAVLGPTRLSHQVGADVLGFRDTFSALFFVSVGMLVDPAFVASHLGAVAALTALVVLGKGAIVLVLGLFFRRPARTFLVVAVGLAQIGEFSFILGQAGVTLGLLAPDQYALVLAAALISITINPFLYDRIPALEKVLRRIPGFWKHFGASTPAEVPGPEDLSNHVAIVGFGRVGRHLVEVLESLKVPLVVVDADVERIEALNRRGTPALYGDAANSEVLLHAHLERARALVVTVPEDTTALLIVTSARDVNPDLPVLVRASTENGVRELAAAGARVVVHPELEGGLELVRHALLSLGFPLRPVHRYAESVRDDAYRPHVDTPAEQRALEELLRTSPAMEVLWIEVAADSPLAGRSVAGTNLRSRTGASIVALVRDGELLANPDPAVVLRAGDRVGVIGAEAQVEAARRAFAEGAAPR